MIMARMLLIISLQDHDWPGAKNNNDNHYNHNRMKIELLTQQGSIKLMGNERTLVISKVMEHGIYCFK